MRNWRLHNQKFIADQSRYRACNVEPYAASPHFRSPWIREIHIDQRTKPGLSRDDQTLQG